MDTATLINLLLTTILVIERLLKQTKHCKSKCCCIEIDTELQSPKRKDYKDSVEQQVLQVEMPVVSVPDRVV